MTRTAVIVATCTLILAPAGLALAGTPAQEIADKYAAKGYLLGGGCGSVVPAPGGAFVKECSGGAIYWSPGNGAHEVHGAIYQKYLSLGAAGLDLGYPSTDEMDVGDNRGKHSDFEYGVIYWTSQTGAHEVHGAIYKRWAQLEWEKGQLKFPITDEYTVPCTGERRSIFQGGDITWSPTTGAHETYGHFFDVGVSDWCWDRVGGNFVFRPVLANCGTVAFNGTVGATTKITLDGLVWPASSNQPFPGGG